MLSVYKKQKKILFARKANLEVQEESQAESAEETAADLITVQAQIKTAETIIANLTDPKAIKEQQSEKTTLEYRLFLLNKKKDSFGPSAYIMKQFELVRVGLELDAIEALILAIENHKKTL